VDLADATAVVIGGGRGIDEHFGHPAHLPAPACRMRSHPSPPSLRRAAIRT
jgi:hypothetical protein